MMSEMTSPATIEASSPIVVVVSGAQIKDGEKDRDMVIEELILKRKAAILEEFVKTTGLFFHHAQGLYGTIKMN